MLTSEQARIDAVTEMLSEMICKEVPELLRSGQNWKLIINASAAGDISTAVEVHCQRVRRFQVVSQAK